MAHDFGIGRALVFRFIAFFLGCNKALVLTAILSIFLSGILFCSSAVADGSEPIQGGTIGPVVSYPQFVGDTWANTWADDDEIYAVANDSNIQGNSCNLAIVRLKGSDPKQLTCECVNKMADYGTRGQVMGPERYTWKGNSLISVDGVLYASISRHDYPGTHIPRPKDMRQTVQDASLIKSTDHGKTWTRTAVENMAQPMWPGRRFSLPCFVQYGRNTAIVAHGSDRYVYAISNDGYWNNGSSIVLGRVPREKIGRLDPADWQFYLGGDRNGADDSAWTNNVAKAGELFADDEHVGHPSIVYLQDRQRYVLMQWHYGKNRWEGPTTWIWRESPTPWGPWTTFYSTTWNADTQYYGPAAITKFFGNMDLSLWLVASGWWGNGDEAYCLHTLPVTLWTPNSLAIAADASCFCQEMGVDLENPKPRTIGVRIGTHAPASLDTEISNDATWLSLQQIPGDDCLRLTQQIHGQGLAVGDYVAQVTLKSPDATPSTLQYDVQLRVRPCFAPVAVAERKPGLKYEYYQGSFGRLPDFLKLSPVRRGVCDTPNLEIARRHDRFAVRYQGYFRALEDGPYIFALESDDGSRLSVAGQQVIDNDGLHEPLRKTGTIWLRAGLHPICIEYFQSTSMTLLSVEVSPPNGVFRKLNTDDLIYEP